MGKKRMFYDVRFGVHPINWCNDDVDYLGDHYSFEDIIDQASQAGYEGIELGRKFPRDPKVLRKAMARRNLVLTTGWCDTMFACAELRDKYFEELKEKVNFFEQMGCGLVVAAEGTNSSCWDPREYRGRKGVKKLSDEEWKRFADGLSEAGQFCRDKSIKLVYHVHTGTVVETYQETQKLMEMTDPNSVFLLADTGHLSYCDVDLVKFYNDFAPRIKYVHLKDLRPVVMKTVKAAELDFNEAVAVNMFTVPGDGYVDFPAVLEALAKNDYQGWMIVEAEQYLNTPDALTFAKMARQYLREITGM
ncbi:MAG: myo-inosose-2 dehydratase [Oscillospiraceae bacterium]|nr:myo-inosose-2 dehydratase [Oscillospiraceae bacterium]